MVKVQLLHPTMANLHPRLALALLLLVLSLSGYVSGKRVLLLPSPATSHINQLVAVGNGLIEQGHEVYLSLTESFPHRHFFENGKMKLLIHKAPERDLYMMSSEDTSAFFQGLIKKGDTVAVWRENIPEIENICRNQLLDDDHYEKLKKLKFDLAIVDIFPESRSLLVLPYSLGVPYIGLVTMQEPWITRTPSLPSFVPSNLFRGAYTPNMNFWQRLNNLWTQVDWHARPGVSYLQDEYVQRYIRDKPPATINGLAAQCMLVLKDEDSLLDYPRPQMPHEVLIGGLTTKPAKPLPEDLEAFMSSSTKGVILMTFGSFSFNMDKHFLGELFKAFAQIDYDIIWKYAEVPKGISSNVKVVSWLPQNDILGHPKTKMFITHCGNNGQMEALYQGVPMIGLPIFGDQLYNCKRLPYHGFGICLNLKQFQSEHLVAAVKEITSNTSFTENIQKAAVIFKDRPMKPLENALYWVGHVMKHGGQHLHSYALDMPWYKYLMLDIAAFVLGVASVFILSCLFMAWWVTKYLTPKAHPPVKQE